MSEPIRLVSLGPGDPELVTLKALKYLQLADVLYCPAASCKHSSMPSRAGRILLALGIEPEKIHYFYVPMNKQRVRAKKDYAKVANNIAQDWAAGDKRVVLCVQGDAGFYASSFYIGELLEAQNIPIQRIAGVPAFIAGGTLANLHIVKQTETLQVLPFVSTYESLQAACRAQNTVVIMKLSQNKDIIKDFIDKNFGYVFHYFENIGVEGKELYTKDTGEISQSKFPYFSLLIIQKTISFKSF